MLMRVMAMTMTVEKKSEISRKNLFTINNIRDFSTKKRHIAHHMAKYPSPPNRKEIIEPRSPENRLQEHSLSLRQPSSLKWQSDKLASLARRLQTQTSSM